MNHLEEAKGYTGIVTGKGSQWAQVSATLAIAHALIALIERMDKATESAEATAERAERHADYEARRAMGMAS